MFECLSTCIRDAHEREHVGLFWQISFSSNWDAMTFNKIKTFNKSLVLRGLSLQSPMFDLPEDSSRHNNTFPDNGFWFFYSCFNFCGKKRSLVWFARFIVDAGDRYWTFVLESILIENKQTDWCLSEFDFPEFDNLINWSEL